MLWIFKKAGEENPGNTDYQFWQQDNHEVECESTEVLDSKMNYLHENPLKAGFVRKAEDYTYSSAINYYLNEKELIAVEFFVKSLETLLHSLIRRDASLNSPDREAKKD